MPNHRLIMQILILFFSSVLPLAANRIFIIYQKNRFGEQWVESWRKNKGKILGYVIFTWTLFVAVPATEEIIFRAPLAYLIAAFPRFTWWIILFDSSLFGLIHVTNNWFNKGQIRPILFDSSKGRPGIVYRIWRFTGTLILGLLLGWQLLLHKSLYRCFWIHIIWNIFVSQILPLIFALFVILAVLIHMAWEFLRQERQPSWGVTMRPGERIGGRPTKINLLPPKSWFRRRHK